MGSAYGLAVAGKASGGSCVARGGQPTGEVVPTTPTTICCAN
jgi:hypothetical protein